MRLLICFIGKETDIKRSGVHSLLLKLLPLFVLAHLGHHLVAALLTPLLPFIRDEFTLDYTKAGVLVSAFTVSYGISQLPAGWLADRLGPRILLALGVAGAALAGIFVGLSSTYIMMAVFLVLLGILGGGYHPSAAPLVSALVEPQNRGKALGIHQIGGVSSFFLAPLIAVTIANALGWRGAYIALAIPTMMFGVIFYFLLGHFGYAQKPKHEVTSISIEAMPEPGRKRQLVAFLALSVAISAMITSIVSFVPLFIVDHFGASEQVADALLSLTYSGGLWAGPLGGYLSDRLGKVPVLIVVGFIACPIIYLLTSASLGWSISVLLLGVGMSMFITMPVSESYIIRRTSERNRSTVLGVYYLASRGGPGILTPLLGYLIDRFSFGVSFTSVSVVLAVVAIICSFLLWGAKD